MQLQLWIMIILLGEMARSNQIGPKISERDKLQNIISLKLAEQNEIMLYQNFHRAKANKKVVVDDASQFSETTDEVEEISQQREENYFSDNQNGDQNDDQGDQNETQDDENNIQDEKTLTDDNQDNIQDEQTFTDDNQTQNDDQTQTDDNQTFTDDEQSIIKDDYNDTDDNTSTQDVLFEMDEDQNSSKSDEKIQQKSKIVKSEEDEDSYSIFQFASSEEDEVAAKKLNKIQKIYSDDSNNLDEGNLQEQEESEENLMEQNVEEELDQGSNIESLEDEYQEENLQSEGDNEDDNQESLPQEIIEKETDELKLDDKEISVEEQEDINKAKDSQSQVNQPLDQKYELPLKEQMDEPQPTQEEQQKKDQDQKPAQTDPDQQNQIDTDDSSQKIENSDDSQIDNPQKMDQSSQNIKQYANDNNNQTPIDGNLENNNEKSKDQKDELCVQAASNATDQELGKLIRQMISGNGQQDNIDPKQIQQEDKNQQDEQKSSAQKNFEACLVFQKAIRDQDQSIILPPCTSFLNSQPSDNVQSQASQSSVLDLAYEKYVTQVKQQQVPNEQEDVSNDCFELFEQCKFKGECVHLCGAFPEIPSELKDTIIKSIKVPDGLRIEFYSEQQFGGQLRAYEQDDPCIQDPFNISVLLEQKSSFIQLKHNKNLNLALNLRIRKVRN